MMSSENTVINAFADLENKDGEAHWYPMFSVFLFTEGSGKQIVNGKEQPFSPGTLLALSPIDFHQCLSTEDYRMKNIFFSADIFYKKLISLCSINDFPIIAQLSPDDYKKTDRLFDMLIDETSRRDNCSEHMKRNLTEQIFLLALNNKPEKKETASETSNPTLNRILMYIYYNFKNDISVEDVASEIHYSTGYFNKMFTKSMGISFHKYLRDLRLKFAYNLLKYGNLSVAEVCRESGFHSVQNFSALFKSRYNCLPRDLK